jgi:hypothetical protein
MHEICEFLEHMEQPRLLEETPEDESEIDVRSEENKAELREKTLLGVKYVTKNLIFYRKKKYMECMKEITETKKKSRE